MQVLLDIKKKKVKSKSTDGAYVQALENRQKTLNERR